MKIAEFCEGEYQVKDDGYTIVKQQSANIPDAGDKQQQPIISNDNAYDERQHKKKDGKAIINTEAVELTIRGGTSKNVIFQIAPIAHLNVLICSNRCQ